MCSACVRSAPAAGEALKDHEQTLFRTFLWLLADDIETQDLVTLLLGTDPAGQHIVLAATGLAPHESTDTMIHLGDEVLRWVHQHNRPLVLETRSPHPPEMEEGGALEPMQAALEQAGLWSAAIFPLPHRGRPVGALVLGRRTGPSPFVFVDLTLAALFGSLLAGAFERLRLFEKDLHMLELAP